MSEEDSAYATSSSQSQSPNISQETPASTSTETTTNSKHLAPNEKTKDLVAKLLAQSSSRLGFEDKILPKRDNSKHSNVWTRFKEATVDGNRVGVFKCVNCSALYLYKSTTGNSAMNRHTCEKTTVAKTSSSQTSRSMSMNQYVQRIVPQEGIRLLNRNITIGLAVDLEPLGRVETKGFLHIAQSLINFGAKYGRQPVSTTIQHRTTLQRNRLPEICGELHQEIKMSMANIPAYPKLCFTSDMWTEKQQSNHFMALSVHYIDDHWVLRKKLLGMELHEDSKTTVNLRSDCRRIIGKYFEESAIDTIMEKSTAVTDGEASMGAVFENREPCQCHNINLFFEWTFYDKKPLTDEQIEKRVRKGNPYPPKKLFNLTRDCPDIAATINGVKNLVTYFKQSHLNSKLSTTLKQEVCTRFNSLLFVLASYQKTAQEVKSILIENKSLDKLLPINDDLVDSLINFMQPFNDCSEVLSGDKYPTINKVALYYFQLRQHIRIREDDVNEMKTLKRQAEHCFNEYCNTNNLHYLACMLDPRYRSLKFADEGSKKWAIRSLQWMIREEEGEVGEIESDSQIVRETRPNEPSSRFGDLQDDVGDYFPQATELDRYLTFRLPECKPDEKFDVLAFWRKATDFPVLQKIARRVLAIPASEVTAERVFSSAGDIMTTHRTMLDSDTLSDLVFVKKNIELSSIEN